ncbi:MAG TPA: SIR2 family protein [Solirubrobacteraceae bacterium]|nr:SIR2 family protein [Solirubrobacteraceae bacterium]
MTDIPWNELIRRIRSGHLTPFLGAGISRPPLPDAAELAATLADQYEYPFIHQDLMEVAQYAATMVDGASPKVAIQERFKQVPDPDFDEPDQAHAILASLPIAVYLTTNYDDYMEKALRACNRTPVTEVCRWNSGLKTRPSHLLDCDPDTGHPVVYHLHGHIDDPDSFVLTEDDYLDFMVNARRFEAVTDRSLHVLPPKVDELISSTSLLFLGYGLRDWNLRVLLRALIQSADRSSQKISVSVQLEPGDSVVAAVGRAKAIEYLQDYFAGLRILVYWGTVTEFLIELKQRWDQPQLNGSE